MEYGGTNPEDYFNEGFNYFNGINGVKQSYQEALSVFLRAAELGHYESMEYLIQMYYNGWGTKRSPEEADKWITDASKYLISNLNVQPMYTIGYANKDISEFVNILKKAEVDFLIDVRSYPYSSYYKDFDEPSLEKTLQDNEIQYISFKNEFGAKRSEKQAYSTINYFDGTTFDVVDFEKVYYLRQFQEGVLKILFLLKTGKKICFMCSENEPHRCHRCIMVSNYFRNKGFTTLHFKSEKDAVCIIDQEILDYNVEECFISESKIYRKKFSGGLDKYLGDSNPTTDYWDEFFSKYEMKKGYKLRNIDIGFRKGGQGSG